MNLKRFWTFILTVFLLTVSAPLYATYKVSVRGESFIKQNEQLSLKAYRDASGWSIGYGHHSKLVRCGQVISKSQAERYFREDMTVVNKTINKLLENKKQRFSQEFIDGLGDLLFNCGEGSVRRSNFYARLQRCRKNNRKDLEYACAAVRNHAISTKGHIERRKKTSKMMTSA